MENNCTALINFLKSNKQELEVFTLFMDAYTKEVKKLIKKSENDNKLKKFLDSILDRKDKELVEEKLKLFYATKIDKNLTFKDILEIKIYKENKISIQFFEDSSKYKYFTKNRFIYKYNLGIITLSKDIIESIYDFDSNLIEIIDNYYPKMIVSFIMNFETFFNELLKFIASKNEHFLLEKLQSEKEITLTYKEILANPTRDWKEYIIDMQLNKLTRNMIYSIDQIIKTTKFTEDIHEHVSDLEKAFKEIYYRRNLIVHNNSSVNEDYINNTGLKNIDKGKKLKTEMEYVFESFTICNKFACLLYAILGTKLEKKDKKMYYDVLEDYAFKLLRKEKWEESLFIYQILLKFNDKFINSANKLNFTFNIFNCKKHLNNISYKDELLKIDISANDVIYKIGKHLLLDENEEVYQLLMVNYPQNISFNEILEWPIFIDFRKTEEFLKFKSEKLTNLNDDYAIAIQD